MSSWSMGMKDIFWWEPSLSKHKAVCFQLSWMKNSLAFMFKLEFTRKQDHSGMDFQIQILGLWFNINFYDCRHWNDEENRWWLPGEEARYWEEEEKKEKE